MRLNHGKQKGFLSLRWAQWSCVAMVFAILYALGEGGYQQRAASREASAARSYTGMCVVTLAQYYERHKTYAGVSLEKQCPIPEEVRSSYTVSLVPFVKKEGYLLTAELIGEQSPGSCFNWINHTAVDEKSVERLSCLHY